METEANNPVAFKPTASLFATELPSPGEIAVLLVCVVGLILIGKILKLRWDQNNEAVPVPVALMMGGGMLAVFFLVVTIFYRRATAPFEDGTYILQSGQTLTTYAPDGNYLGILAWCMIAFAFPLFYYGLIIVNAFATRVIDRVSPFGMQIHEPSEFAEARKMALRGDVDGAVKRYRGYLENTDVALFEAARLLKSEDRYPEAAALFLEISQRFYGKKPIWAEAVYHLAKLRESHLHQAKESMALLNEILERTPDSRFGKLAETELVRMNLVYGPTDSNELVADIPEGEDPFFNEDDARFVSERDTPPAAGGNGHHAEPVDAAVHEHEDGISPVDPFFAAAQRNREIDAAAEDAANAAAATASESADQDSGATTKKTSSKKKT